MKTIFNFYVYTIQQNRTERRLIDYQILILTYKPLKFTTSLQLLIRATDGISAYLLLFGRSQLTLSYSTCDVQFEVQSKP